MGTSTKRRRTCLLVSATGLWLAADEVSAARGLDSTRVQGLELADGRVVVAPVTEVWGSERARANGSAALARLRDDVGPVWLAWDDARGCASGLMFAGVDVPGSVASASVAEAFAQTFVARHLAAIAPGSDPADFVVVANELSHGIRTIGFEQRSGGVPVVGGGLGLRFSADRLVYVSASVLPAVPSPSSAASGTFVLPIWTGREWQYHHVVRSDVESRAPLGHWWVYRDAATGAFVAREQRMLDAVTVRFDVPVRHPGLRYDAVAPQLDLLEGGNGTTTNLAGQVVLSNSPTTLEIAATGAIARAVNNAGENASTGFNVNDGDSVTWSLADDEFGDAQTSAFVHMSIVNAYVRNIAPGLDWLDEQVTANVNIDNTCNAVSDGNQLYFFRAGDCQNTARLADVVYHEFGHSVHRAAIIPGVGAQQSSLSEGISDYLAATMTGDSGMGRGFTFSESPLRELNPPDYEWSWPQDTGESHSEGRIIGGTLWDLRTELRTKLGDDEGRAHSDLLWYEAIRRATDIPSMYPNVLVADDDDGNLANGTPNLCEINAVFQAHGLLDPSQLGELAHELVPVDDGRQVVVTQMLPVFEDCPVEAGDVELSWRLRDTPDDVTTVLMDVQDGAWVSTIPSQATGAVVEYQVRLTYSNGTSTMLPRNPADPWYQTYFGGAQPIYCLDGEADPSQWTFAGPGAWSFGPLGTAGVDPGEPYDDDGVLLSMDGIYMPNIDTSATGPVIDLTGHQDVRLHYRRWLTVEDATFDHANIYANDAPVWANLATEQANTQHVDHEWRFQDIPLDAALASGAVQLRFALTSDGGLQFGGWTIDSLCVVEVVESFCGDGTVDSGEECDDENTEDGDGCDASCELEDPDPTEGTTDADTSGDGTGSATFTTGADGTVTGGTADGTDGTTGDSEQDGTSDGCGCTTNGTRGSAMLPLLVGLALRRRRARA